MTITVTANVKRVSFKAPEPVPVAEVVAKTPETTTSLPKIELDNDYKVNDLIMDATPLISQPYSHYKKFSKNYYTTPTVYNEIKSSNARKELEEYWNPLGNLQVRHPKSESIKFVKNFSLLTGDFNVLSENDMHILALAYEIHVEKLGKKNLREHPGQKLAEQIIEEKAEELKKKKKNNRRGGKKQKEKKALREKEQLEEALKSNVIEAEATEVEESSEQEQNNADLSEESTAESNEGVYDEEEDEDDWITPENLAKQILKDQGKNVDCEDTEKTDDVNNLVALATGDFAVQNVALQINLSLMNFTNGLRITKVRNYRLRCHACFHMIAEPKDFLSNTKVMKKLHFCPSCGGAGTLLRCAVSVDCKTGEITPHLKANFQWFKRGLKYSIASPQSANSKKRYGKKGYDQVKAYHNTPILQEDQPEYAKMMKQHNWVNRHNEKVLNQYYEVSGSGSTIDNTASVNNVINPFEIDGLKSHKLTVTDGNRYINTNGANGNNKNNNGLKRKTRGRRRR